MTFYQGEGGVVYQLVQLENDQLMIPSNLGLAKETRNLPFEPTKPTKSYMMVSVKMDF